MQPVDLVTPDRLRADVCASLPAICRHEVPAGDTLMRHVAAGNGKALARGVAGDIA